MKHARFQENWKNVNTRDSYDKQSRPYTERRYIPFDRRHDRNLEHHYYYFQQQSSHRRFDESPCHFYSHVHDPEYATRPPMYRGAHQSQSRSYHRYDNYEGYSRPIRVNSYKRNFPTRFKDIPYPSKREHSLEYRRQNDEGPQRTDAPPNSDQGVPEPRTSPVTEVTKPKSQIQNHKVLPNPPLIARKPVEKPETAPANILNNDKSKTNLNAEKVDPQPTKVKTSKLEEPVEAAPPKLSAVPEPAPKEPPSNNPEPTPVEPKKRGRRKKDPEPPKPAKSAKAPTEKTPIKEKEPPKKPGHDVSNHTVHEELNDIFNDSLNRRPDHDTKTRQVYAKTEPGNGDVSSVETKNETQEVGHSPTDYPSHPCESLKSPVNMSGLSKMAVKPESPTTKKDGKRKVSRRSKQLSDTINLNKKITRLAQSSYESQLKLAIEMSIKDCNTVSEITDNTDKISEASLSSDSDYGGRPRKKMVKSQRGGHQRRMRGGKGHQGLKKMLKSKKSLDEMSGTDLLNGLSPSGFARDHIRSISAETLRDGLSPSDHLSPASGKNVWSSELFDMTDENMVTQMKMRAFEEYLSMSERLYCGRTLVDDLLGCGLNGNFSNASSRSVSTHMTTASKIKLKEKDKEKEREKEREKDADNSSVHTTSSQDAAPQNDGKQPNGKDKPDEDKLFRFNCSKLDLLYRVSFNILKSSHRQPQVIDLWGPKELVLFELGLFKYGKEFHEIQRDIPSKSVQEIVDMYYLWKKSSRYKLWKANRYY